MSLENVDKFQEMLASSEELQEKFKAAVDAVAEGASEEDSFNAVIGQLAQEVGLPFTFEEAKQRAEEGTQLTDEQLDNVAGGWKFCVGWGVGTTDYDAQHTCPTKGGYGFGYCPSTSGFGSTFW